MTIPRTNRTENHEYSVQLLKKTSLLKAKKRKHGEQHTRSYNLSLSGVGGDAENIRSYYYYYYKSAKTTKVFLLVGISQYQCQLYHP